jgi:hypothetical protein
MENHVSHRRHVRHPRNAGVPEAVLGIALFVVSLTATITAVCALCVVAIHMADKASGCHGLWRTALSELLQCGSASIIGWLSDQMRWLSFTVPSPGEMTLSDLGIVLAALAGLAALVVGGLALAMLLMGWCGDFAEAIGAKFRDLK